FLFSNAEAETLKSECYFGPYAGYHYFLHGSDYKDKPEIGINFEKYLEKPWSYQLSLGYVPAKSKTIGVKKNLYILGIDGVYNFDDFKISTFSFSPYIAGGLNLHIGSADEVSGLDGAAGLKYFYNEKIMIKSEVKYMYLFKHNRDDLLISTAIGFAFGKKKNVSVSQAPQSKPSKFENGKYDESGKLQSVTLKINFATDKSDVLSEYFAEIEQFANFMKENPGIKAEIQGHTDNVGNTEYNLKLSEERANSVRNIFINNYQISSDRLTAKGYGAEKPVASNDTEEGRKQNRRIEAAILSN
ncbi:OmpA family protein, partial [Candidatus Dependentiae bacterium]|nr:OmpA family protein [Candidatus Dependentiae bacterium]